MNDDSLDTLTLIKTAPFIDRGGNHVYRVHDRDGEIIGQVRLSIKRGVMATKTTAIEDAPEEELPAALKLTEEEDCDDAAT